MTNTQGGVDLPTLIAALGEVRAYPHPVREVRVVQTHISCVFLTGDYVYKVKKPVDFGFVDYGTLEKRRRCCEQEVVLNRRLCPEVYLDVVPIGREASGLRVGSAGRAVEWAVRMRQLPDEAMLTARLAADRVSPGDIGRIADVLAAFHARAATGAEIAARGSPEAVAENVEENFAQTERRTGEALPEEHLAAVREYARRFLADHRELFLERVRRGRVRDGHGDLRAQNICLYEGLGNGVQILDCVEFNDRFRYGDVAADLAYLAMDLDLAGRVDLRQVLLDRYGAASGDEGLRRVLPFYCCYRAHVRGKIALLAAEEPEIPADQRQAHRELAAAAFDLCRSYAARRERPALLITVGPSGSGKSVLARALARRLPALRIASDEVRKELLGVAPATRLGAEQYTSERRRAVYEELRRRAALALRAGEHVLLDATFLSPEERRKAASLAREEGAELWVLECRCPPALIRERLRGRAGGPDASDAGIAVYEAQGEVQRSPEELAWPGWVTVDTGQPAEGAARETLERFWRRSQAVRVRDGVV